LYVGLGPSIRPARHFWGGLLFLEAVHGDGLEDIAVVVTGHSLWIEGSKAN
jgi:hypothetical protein